MARKRHWLSFIAGMLTGTIFIVCLAAAAVYLGSNQTLALRINTFGIAERLEGAAQLMARDMLPLYIEDLKGRIPVLVQESVSSQFGNVKFQLGGEEFVLPQEFVNQLEDNYRASVINSINDILNSLPMEQMSTELGTEAAELVEQALYAEFNSRLIEIDIIENALTVPIMIELVDQEGVNAFHLQLYSDQADLKQ